MRKDETRPRVFLMKSRPIKQKYCRVKFITGATKPTEAKSVALLMELLAKPPLIAKEGNYLRRYLAIMCSAIFVSAATAWLKCLDTTETDKEGAEELADHHLIVEAKLAK
jgi:hypothetical protein